MILIEWDDADCAVPNPRVVVGCQEEVAMDFAEEAEVDFAEFMAAV